MPLTDSEPQPAWIEVCLAVDGELAEAVSEVLARYVGGGIVVSAKVHDGDSPEPRLSNDLKVCAYLTAQEATPERRDQIRKALWYLGRIHKPIPEPIFEPLVDVDWAEHWKQHYEPVSIGERLIIVPAWLENPDPDRLPIRIEPGMAFGTGTHPTTQLALTLLERVIEDRPSPQFTYDLIDVGCGSGILSIAARRLGAMRILGFDIESQAIQSAQSNAMLNGFNDVEWRQGSVVDMRSTFPSGLTSPVVVINILARLIVPLFDEGLADLLSPGGHMVLSGILVSQEDDLVARMTQAGLGVVERIVREDWIGLIVVRQ
jgi:ribosomal protein L11 methyltransferase